MEAELRLVEVRTGNWHLAGGCPLSQEPHSGNTSNQSLKEPLKRVLPDSLSGPAVIASPVSASQEEVFLKDCIY